MAGPTLEAIVHSLNERRKARGPQIANMQRIRDAYNGDIVIPLPELDKNELPAVINFVNTGLEQLAGRAASVQPDVFYPPMREGFDKWMELARDSRRATLGWWRTNNMSSKLQRRARFMYGYAESPVLLRPNPKWGISKWEVRSPLGAYPCPTGDPDDLIPPDCIFTFTRSYGWLRDRYPEQAAALTSGKPMGQRPDNDDPFEIIEYVDDQVTVLAAVSKGQQDDGRGWFNPVGSSGSKMIELERVINRTGICPVVAPSRITLDRPMGQFDGMLGMYLTAAKMTALEIIAVERGIFPNTYLVSRPNETARFIAGPFDGRTGEVNIIAGGDIKEDSPNPGFATTNTIDRIQNAARATGGIASEMFGESPTNVRTGKRGDAVMSGIVDVQIQTVQETLARSLEAENRIAVAQAKTYFGTQRRSFYVNSKTFKGHVDYVPNDTFVTDTNVVTYPLVGSDINGLMVGLGQRVASGIMSAQTAAEIDPLTDDPELERRRIVAEALDRSMLQGVEAQATNGAIPPHFIARMKTLVLSGMSLEDAMDAVQKEAQQLQATPAPAGSPETQPGIAQEGAGAQAPAVAPPTSSQDNLAAVLQALRTPMRPNPGQGRAA